MENMLDALNPYAIAREIASRMKQRRIELRLTQQELARMSGVSLGSLKRFELSCEISLKHLLMLAVVLNATNEFTALFGKQQFTSLDEVLKATGSTKRKRGRRHE
ncbi:MAG: helix-turn-helix transcriptional regulator [Bacteroidales bacterium]|nr:helix-turn-helix transcriptional regulator [Bacteroidales bacterium]